MSVANPSERMPTPREISTYTRTHRIGFVNQSLTPVSKPPILATPAYNHEILPPPRTTTLSEPSPPTHMSAQDKRSPTPDKGVGQINDALPQSNEEVMENERVPAAPGKPRLDAVQLPDGDISDGPLDDPNQPPGPPTQGGK